jgi:hypothetical protein
LDEPEPYSKKDFDFIYVDMQCRWHKGLFPYTGARWYCPEVCEWLLDKGIISEDMCKAGLRASRHVPSAVIRGHIDTLRAVCETMGFAERELRAFQKQGILSMIGLWNISEQHAYRAVHSDYQIDAAGAKLRRQLDDGSFVWTCCDTIVDLYSMAPWGRIALDIEQLRVAQALDFLKGLPAKVLGVLVDGVMFSWNSFEAVPDIGLRFPDGSPIFQLKPDTYRDHP